MANHKSAVKRHKQSEKRRIRNGMLKSALSTQIKKARADIAEKKAKPDSGEVQTAVKMIAKAATKGVIKKLTANRKISRLMQQAHKVPLAAVSK